MSFFKELPQDKLFLEDDLPLVWKLDPCNDNSSIATKTTMWKNNRTSSSVNMRTNEVRFPCICSLHSRCPFQHRILFPPPAQYPTQTHPPKSFHSLLYHSNNDMSRCLLWWKEILNDHLVKTTQNFGWFWANTMPTGCSRLTELELLNPWCSLSSRDGKWTLIWVPGTYRATEYHKTQRKLISSKFPSIGYSTIKQFFSNLYH